MVDIYPINDIRPHTLSINNMTTCECCPIISSNGVVHHIAFDAREFIEDFPDEDWFLVTYHSPSTYYH